MTKHSRHNETLILDFAQPLADRFYQEGVQYEEQGAVDEAVVAFERALQANGTHAPAHLALAYHCRRQDHLDAALAHCEAALAQQPTAEAYFLLGHVLIAQEQFPAALETLHRCLDLNPTFDRARYQIAFVYYLQGEYEVAVTEFHRAAQHEPEWETLFFLGECYRMTRRPAEAERTFRRALAHTSNWTQIELTRGQLQACQRLAEFPGDDALSPKDRAYCDSGIIYLGTSPDDGITIPPYLFHNFEYADLARTLRRFLALKEAQGWRWGAVVPVDIVSLPLALALGQHLGVGTEPRRRTSTLVVQALGETMEGMQDAVERLDEARSFCLMVCWPEEWRPDVVGLVTPLVGSLPWYRTSAIPQLYASLLGRDTADEIPQKPSWLDPRPAEAIAADILAALASTPADPNLHAQVAYYRHHARLRWR